VQRRDQADQEQQTPYLQNFKYLYMKPLMLNLQLDMKIQMIMVMQQ
jgi:hypothetical protein